MKALIITLKKSQVLMDSLHENGSFLGLHSDVKEGLSWKKSTFDEKSCIEEFEFLR